MDPIENAMPAPESQEDIQAQLARLRQLVHSLLVLGIVLSGTLAVFFYHQLWYTRKELDQIRANFAQYNRTAGAATDEFYRKLAVFSKTHPDYQPIAAKYGLLTNAPAATAPAPSKPVPAAPAKK